MLQTTNQINHENPPRFTPSIFLISSGKARETNSSAASLGSSAATWRRIHHGEDGFPWWFDDDFQGDVHDFRDLMMMFL